MNNEKCQDRFGRGECECNTIAKTTDTTPYVCPSCDGVGCIECKGTGDQAVYLGDR